MPKSWFGVGSQDSAAPPSGKSLLAQDIRFLRKVKSIRKPLISTYTWLAYFHCLLRGKDVKTLNIRTKMPDIGGLEDQMKMELIKLQAEVLGMLGDVMTQYNLPKEAWVELIFKKYLHMPDDIVDIFITALPAQAEPEMESRQAAPTERALMEVIGARLSARPQLLYDLKAKARPFYPDEPGPATKWQQQPGRILFMPAFEHQDQVRVSTEAKAILLEVRQSATSKKGQLTESVEDGPSSPGASQAANGQADTGNDPKPNGEAMPNSWRRYMRPKG